MEAKDATQLWIMAQMRFDTRPRSHNAESMYWVPASLLLPCCFLIAFCRCDVPVEAACYGLVKAGSLLFVCRDCGDGIHLIIQRVNSAPTPDCPRRGRLRGSFPGADLSGRDSGNSCRLCNDSSLVSEHIQHDIPMGQSQPAIWC